MVAKLQKENEALREKLQRLQAQRQEQGYDWGGAQNAGTVGVRRGGWGVKVRTRVWGLGGGRARAGPPIVLDCGAT
jgi:hypothetical protein